MAKEKPAAAHNFLNANFWLFAPCHCEQILKIQICLTRGNATLAMTAFLPLLWLFMPLLSTTFTKKADNTALKRDKNKDK